MLPNVNPDTVNQVLKPDPPIVNGHEEIKEPVEPVDEELIFKPMKNSLDVNSLRYKLSRIGTPVFLKSNLASYKAIPFDSN